MGGMARRDTAREEAFRGGVKKPVSPASSKVDPPLANGYRGRPVNAFRQYLVLVKFKSIVALRSIEGLRHNGFLTSFPWYEADLDGS